MTLFSDRPANILVVDDDKELANMLVKFLNRMGFNAVAAYDGREGLVRFERKSFQLVITDLQMPDMDGLALLEAVKMINPRVMVMMISGYGTVEKVMQAVKKGAYDFIPKPLELKQLEVIIQRAIQQYALTRRLERFQRLIRILAFSVPAWFVLGMVVACFWK